MPRRHSSSAFRLYTRKTRADRTFDVARSTLVSVVSRAFQRYTRIGRYYILPIMTVGLYMLSTAVSAERYIYYTLALCYRLTTNRASNPLTPARV